MWRVEEAEEVEEMKEEEGVEEGDVEEGGGAPTLVARTTS